MTSSENPNGPRTARPLRRVRRGFVAISQITMIGLLSLVLLEVVLRIGDFTPPLQRIGKDRVRLSPNPILGYELNPNSPEINSIGLRDREFEVQKPPSMTRIVVI